MNTFEINKAFAEARREIRVIEDQAYQISELACDSAILRKMPGWRLKKLKAKLKYFNAHTQIWKGEK